MTPTSALSGSGLGASSGAIGILGGTFDPVHRGHVESARELCRRLQLDVLYLLPCYIPPHRDRPATPAADRLAMVELAAAPYPELAVDGRELARGGSSYTVDTLAELRSELGATASLNFVMGSDAYNGLHCWRDWRGLFEFANIVVMEREGHALSPDPAVAEWISSRRTAEAQLNRRPAGGFTTLALTSWPQSATEIRERLDNGESLTGLVADEVVEYIRARGLYTRQDTLPMGKT